MEPMIIGPGQGRAFGNGRDVVARDKIRGIKKGRRSKEEGYLIQPGGGLRRERALGGFLEEVISELEAGGVLLVRG